MQRGQRHSSLGCGSDQKQGQGKPLSLQSTPVPVAVHKMPVTDRLLSWASHPKALVMELSAPQGSWQEGAVSALTFVRCIFNLIALVDGSSVSFSAAGDFHLISSLPSVPKKEAGRICRRDRSAVRGRKRNQHSVTGEKISGKPGREDLGAFVRCWIW